MSEVDISADEEENDVDMLCEVAWRVLDAAARMGYVEVVKFAADYARETEETGPASEMSRALSNAIDRGNIEVGEFLINAPQYHWGMVGAFKQALQARQRVIVEMIYEVHPESVDGGSLIVHLARGDGAQYLQNNVQVNYKLMDDAFVCSSLCERVDIIKVLFDTGCVSQNMVDTSFICTARYGCIDSVSFLLSRQLYSSW